MRAEIDAAKKSGFSGVAHSTSTATQPKRPFPHNLILFVLPLSIPELSRRHSTMAPTVAHLHKLVAKNAKVFKYVAAVN